METKFSFMDKIKKNENKNENESFISLYTQALNGLRVKKHAVTYVFDEVGCGKTVSAIIAMASIIEEKCKKDSKEEFKEDFKQDYKILVITPKSVCAQFEKEIRGKLNVVPLNVMNICDSNGAELKQKINNICNSVIVVTNPHKVCKLLDIKWDLVIVDEAHDIICNSQEQTYMYYDYDKYNRSTKQYETKNRIDDEYTWFCEQYEKELIPENLKDHFKMRKEYISNKEKDNNPIAKFAKSIVVEEYRRYMNYGMCNIIYTRRDNANSLFKDLCDLKSEKVMFLTATPYKYDKDFDFINYALVGTKITTEGLLLCGDNFPDLEWVNDLYSASSVADMIESNTSLMFKEIAQSVQLESDASKEIVGKKRKVEVWDEKSEEKENEGSVLRNKLLGENGILKSDNNDNGKKNRVIIFVSNSNEGKIIFDRIFPKANFDILNDHTLYKNKDTNDSITCEFIMNKFGNAANLQNYAKEPDKESKIEIPDILIVTWQVAQVGVNLPTYNYVINYHIPSIPGYLEQRYGRIDRLNSENDTLYNIYYLDNELSTQVYRVNLIRALYIYEKEIMDIPHNLPVKNLLICKDLNVGKIDCGELYNSLAYYIYSYCYIEKNIPNEKINKWKDKLNNNNKTSTEKNNLTVNKEVDINISDNYKTQITNNKEICYAYPEKDGSTKYQQDDEINENTTDSNKDNAKNESINNSDENEKIKTENVEKQIEDLIDYIRNCERINLMVEKLNDKKIEEAGSIIFWNNNSKQMVVECKNIVECIIKAKNE